MRMLRMFGSFNKYHIKSLAKIILCYIEYETDEQVKKALNGFHGLMVKDSKLCCRRLTNSQAAIIFGSNGLGFGSDNPDD
jgi:hypothetical protein